MSPFRVLPSGQLGTGMGAWIYRKLPLPVFESGGVIWAVGRGSMWCWLFPYFLAGATFYIYQARIRYTLTGSLIALAVSAIAARIPPFAELVFPLTLPYLLFAFAFLPSWLTRLWPSHIDVSYGIYLYAFPIQQLPVMGIPGMTPIGLFLIATPLSIMAGIFSWFLVEKPFQSLKPRSRSANSVERSTVVESVERVRDEEQRWTSASARVV